MEKLMSERIIDIEDEDEAYSELTKQLLDMIRSPQSHQTALYKIPLAGSLPVYADL
jgi:hypothetical protein